GLRHLTDPEMQGKFPRATVHFQLQTRRWAAAQKSLMEIDDPEIQAIYQPIFHQIDHMRNRKPGVAAFLSTLIPGLGKGYAGQWVDGFSALVMVGVTGFGAYRFFRERGFGNVLGWGLAGLSGTFYIANIVGSHKAARRYNEKQERDVLDRLHGITERDF
ncbi:MAG: hypothetical protein AAF570_10785, partial [Bacteroidota bacterium]